MTIFTRTGIERIARFAFETARSRPRKLLTYVTKSNAMRNGMVLWDEVIESVAKEFPDVVSRLLTRPSSYAHLTSADNRPWTTCSSTL